MIIYNGTKTDFLKSVEEDTIALEIEAGMYQKMNRHTASNEFRAWENSLEYMYKVPELQLSITFLTHPEEWTF